MEILGLSLVKFGFVVITFLTVFLGYLIQALENQIPAFISQIYRYGKFGYKGPARYYSLRVPKCWFRHFYLFSSFFSTVALIGIFRLYVYKQPLPEHIFHFLDFIGGEDRKTLVSATSTYVAGFLMLLQCYKRCYETHVVSIFSNSSMDINHYFLGFYHYFGAIAAIVLESPGFTRNLGQFDLDVKLSSLSLIEISAILLFLYAWWKQFESASILAGLRRNKDGKVVTQKHLIPKGGLFDKISSPHITCEILMYLCLSVILYGSETWPFVGYWVLSNQVSVALLNHKWYQTEFKNYPKERKALIPWLI